MFRWLVRLLAEDGWQSYNNAVAEVSVGFVAFGLPLSGGWLTVSPDRDRPVIPAAATPVRSCSPVPEVMRQA